ncbi:MAG TPA: hypothetical protein VFY55_04230 [Nitrososphaeraceae archaeon]|nr:hypothetical protein [Nitrososphaeraceae archaeon]
MDTTLVRIKKCVAVIEFKQGWVIRHFEADKLHSELRNLVWYSIKFIVTKQKSMKDFQIK